MNPVHVLGVINYAGSMFGVIGIDRKSSKGPVSPKAVMSLLMNDRGIAFESF